MPNAGMTWGAGWLGRLGLGPAEVMSRADAADQPGLSLRGWLRFAAAVLAFGLVYGIAARIGLAYSSLAPNVTLLWAPTGISLFVVLRFGPRLWPGIVLGDLIANAGTGVPVWAILGIASGNILQTLFCAWSLQRVGFHEGLARVRDVVVLLSMGTAGAALSATVGPGALLLAGAIAADVYPSVWLQWLMGDATGVVVMAPLLLAWWRPGALEQSRRRRLEALLLLAVLALLCEVIFGAHFNSWMQLAPGYYPTALALFPLAVWAALRFGLRGATLFTLLVSVAAVWGTVNGLGPFVDGTQTSSLLRWWMFANVITVTTLVLSASQSERDAARLEAIRDRDFTNAVLDAEGALVVVLDDAWQIQRVNRAFEQATGRLLVDVAGQRFEAALVPDAQHDKFNAHAELLRLNLSDSGRLELPLRRRRAPPLIVSWTTSVLRDAAGRVQHVVVSGADISARVEAAESLRQARRQLQDRVAERTSALAQANADLKVQMAERQRLEAEILQVSERTQQRFGQELHDGLGQHLTAGAIQAELLARDLADAGTMSAAQAAQRIEAMLSDAVSQTRRLARGLFPVEIEAGGLMAALQELAVHTRQTLRRPCELSCPHAVAVADPAVAIHLYRIAQEAVNNAMKHAPGAAIRILLQREASSVHLVIENDGPRGRPATPIAGIGLAIMRHRAQMIRADLQAGEIGDCWRVSVRVPDERRARERAR
jgi:PAS domain S-box-containing protein